MVTNLVLIPGLDGSHVLFGPLLAALPPEIRPLVVPLPESGPNDYGTLTRYVRERIAGLVDPVILAWSFAGPIGVRLAAEPSVGARALILAASFISNPHPWFGPLRPIASPWLFAAYPFAARAKAILGRHGNEEFRQLLKQAMSTLTGRVLTDRVRALLAVDETQTIAGLRLPILDLRSGSDWVVPPHNARTLARACPHAVTKVLDGPHAALATHSVAAVAAIVAFLRESAAPSSAPDRLE